jgi:hypothetical protein
VNGPNHGSDKIHVVSDRSDDIPQLFQPGGLIFKDKGWFSRLKFFGLFMKTVSQSLLIHDAKLASIPSSIASLLVVLFAGCAALPPNGTGFRDGFNGGRNRVMRWFISCAQ